MNARLGYSRVNNDNSSSSLDSENLEMTSLQNGGNTSDASVTDYGLQIVSLFIG